MRCEVGSVAVPKHKLQACELVRRSHRGAQRRKTVRLLISGCCLPAAHAQARTVHHVRLAMGLEFPRKAGLAGGLHSQQTGIQVMIRG
jgi:hypothetical protein